MRTFARFMFFFGLVSGVGDSWENMTGKPVERGLTQSILLTSIAAFLLAREEKE